MNNTRFIRQIFGALLVLGLCHAGIAQAVTLVFTDNTTPDNPYPGFIEGTDFAGGVTPPYNIPFNSGNEFAVAAPTNGGNAGGQKDVMFGDGTEKWVFDAISGELTAVEGMLGGNTGTGIPGSPCPAPNTCGILQQAAFFIFTDFVFLAPVVGSPAGNQYGPGQVTVSGSDLEVFFPVLEAQWAGAMFPLGSAATPDRDGGLSTGVLFKGTIASDQFRIHTQHRIEPGSEDPGGVGFGLFIPTWELTGTILGDPVNSNVLAEPQTLNTKSQGNGFAVTISLTDTDGSDIDASGITDGVSITSVGAVTIPVGAITENVAARNVIGDDLQVNFNDAATGSRQDVIAAVSSVADGASVAVCVSGTLRGSNGLLRGFEGCDNITIINKGNR